MLNKLLKNTDWKQLTAFVSPAFFDVMPVGQLLRRGRALRVSPRGQVYADTVQRRASQLASLPLCIELSGAEDRAAGDSLPDDAQGDAARAVTLYFHQLYSDAPTLLDLRQTSLKRHSGVLRWHPAAWVCDWDADFLARLRDIYSGFYRDDDETFYRGLDALNLRVADDLFREHFGENQQAHQFVVADFVRTFHEVFVRCRDAGVKLHAEFLPLGIYLASLYDGLDANGTPVDVRACFERAVSHALKHDAQPEDRHV